VEGSTSTWRSRLRRKERGRNEARRVMSDQPIVPPEERVAFTCWSCGAAASVETWKCSVLTATPLYSPVKCPGCGEVNDVPQASHRGATLLRAGGK
jgi:hypothetical protein